MFVILEGGAGLYRQRDIDPDVVVNFIASQPERPGYQHSYRMVLERCRLTSNETDCWRNRIMSGSPWCGGEKGKKTAETSLQCTEPNYGRFFFSSYDMLKPHGIAIYGCIDSLSRNIIWRVAFLANNDPQATAGYLVSSPDVRSFRFLRKYNRSLLQWSLSTLSQRARLQSRIKGFCPGLLLTHTHTHTHTQIESEGETGGWGRERERQR